MSTADKTKKLSVNSVGSSLGLRLGAGYRWIVSVFARRRGFTPENDTRTLNAYQMRDLGLHDRQDMLSTRQEKLETMRFNAFLMTMGMNGR